MFMIQFTNSVFLVGLFGRHQKTSNCQHAMSPLIKCVVCRPLIRDNRWSCTYGPALQLVTVLLRLWRQQQPENSDVTINRNWLSIISVVILELVLESEQLDQASDLANDALLIVSQLKVWYNDMKCIDHNIYIIRHILEWIKHIESMYVINKCR